MKTIRSSILCLVVLLLLAPLLRAQDLSKYRHFALGMSLTRVLNRTERQMADVKVLHGRPALIQELTWWPPNLPGASFQADTVEQMLFSFQNGELLEIDSAKIDSYDAKQKLVATWEDSQYSFNLVRSSFSDVLGLVIYSKRANGEAELAIAEAVKLDKQEGPQREAERQKKQTDDLETTRQKNRKIFRP
ncbi:MAG: hypothetical protein DMG42_23160 [Acidobacteria bacterium]|nr:MAG: hypothetical protein DMG42_23160 [Acidobacteriota bacterium]